MMLPKLQFDKRRQRVKQCPCGKSNKDGKFAPFIGYENCGYCHSCEKTYFPDLNKNSQKKSFVSNPCRFSKPNSKKTSFISLDTLKKSLNNYEANNFVSFLIKQFGIETTNRLIEKYLIGTSKYWQGATVFWQIDNIGRIRTGKIMLYNSINGKRIKEPYNHITWVHRVLYLLDFNLKQCFFGEHLLTEEPNKPVAIVESEKTAIIASIYFPNFIWIATGSISNLSIKKCDVLQNRNVILFPDANSYDAWHKKANELANTVSIKISDLLEKKSSIEEKKNGLDIADYLIKS